MVCRDVKLSEEAEWVFMSGICRMKRQRKS